MFKAENQNYFSADKHKKYINANITKLLGWNKN